MIIAIWQTTYYLLILTLLLLYTDYKILLLMHLVYYYHCEPNWLNKDIVDLTQIPYLNQII